MFRRVQHREQIILEKQASFPRVPHSGGTSVSSAGFFFEQLGKIILEHRVSIVTGLRSLVLLSSLVSFYRIPGIIHIVYTCTCYVTRSPAHLHMLTAICCLGYGIQSAVAATLLSLSRRMHHWHHIASSVIYFVPGIPLSIYCVPVL